MARALPDHVQDPKTLRLSLRLSEGDRRLWQAAADAEGMTLGAFIRRAATRTARATRRLRTFGTNDRYLDALKSGETMADREDGE